MALENVRLDTIANNLKYELSKFHALGWPQAINADYAAAMQNAWRCHRRLGIAHLLLECDAKRFFAELREAAEMRRKVLRATHSVQNDSSFIASCHKADMGPLFDALACGAIYIATAIVQSSEASFCRRYEYEEDFWYAECLHLLILGADNNAVTQLLEKFLSSTDGDATPRYKICTALLARDHDAFEDALIRLIEDHEAHYQRLAEGIVNDPEGFLTEQYVMIEGLGLNVLANSRGMRTIEEHLTMPSDANVLLSKTLGIRP